MGRERARVDASAVEEIGVEETVAGEIGVAVGVVIVIGAEIGARIGARIGQQRRAQSRVAAITGWTRCGKGLLRGVVAVRRQAAMSLWI